MINLVKKIILVLIILIIIVCSFIFLFDNNSVDVYIECDEIAVESHTFSSIDTTSLNTEICDLTLNVMNNTTSNITTLKDNITNICNEYGLDDVTINVDSIIGSNQIPVKAYVDGNSMFPTLKDGQSVIFNKTHDIHVGDIVVAESSEYGGIIKRVGEIDGNSVYLVSDNKDVSYEYINGAIYEVKGITTWVDISDINGVVIDY